MILTIANQKGGVGKTTFLVNFAYYLKDYQKKTVLVIDTDTQRNCTFSLEKNADILGDTYELFVSNIKNKDLKINFEKINLFKSTIDMSDINELKEKKIYLNNLKYLNDFFDFILIDTAPVLSDKITTSLQISDYVITPIELELYSLQGLSLMLNIINNIKIRHNNKMQFLGVLPSRVITTNKRQINNLNNLYENYGKDLFLPFIKYRNAIADAISNQVSFFSSTSKYKKEFKEVLDTIYKKMEIGA